jgi:1,4-dihydroxy-2-naphthoate octaprenyltransferase
MWSQAFVGFYRPNGENLRDLDPVARFLYAARSVILVISAQAAVIAGLLALSARAFSLPEFLGVLVGFVVAHMISNLSNDYFGFRRGHDTPDSPRMRYTIHPLASGALTSRALAVGLAVLAAVGLAIMCAFIVERGWLAVGIAATGVALLFLYDAAPTPLKSVGLGELATFVVWGPLMIGGGYAMIAGRLDAGVVLASLPFGLGVMSILTGKHIDQMSFDAGRGIRTLPVIIGETAARRLVAVCIVAMYAIVFALAATGVVSRFCLIVVVAVPEAVVALRRSAAERPAAPPPGYVGWPLWHHRACLVHNRRFGWAYIAGLALGAIAAHIPA